MRFGRAMALEGMLPAGPGELLFLLAADSMLAVHSLCVRVRASKWKPLILSRKRREQRMCSFLLCSPKGPHYFESLLPLLTSAVRGKSHRYMVELMGKWGDNFIVRFPFPWSRWIFLNEPQAIQALLIDINPEKSDDFKRGMSALGKDGLLTAENTTWLQERRRIAPTMTERYVGDLHLIFEEEGAHLWARLEKAARSGESIEMDNAFVGTLFDITARITIGRSLGLRADASSNPMTADFGTALDEAMRRIVLPPGGGVLTALTPDGRRYRQAFRRIDQLLDDCVQQRLQELGGGTTKTTDLLGVLLDAYAEGVLSLQQVKDQLLTFLVAGHDTTAHTLSWMAWEIVQKPGLQDALAAETRLALPSRVDVTSKTSLSKLSLLDRVWQESLRKHPVAATGTLRQLKSMAMVPTSIGVDGLDRGSFTTSAHIQLPAHSKISIPPFSIHRNHKHWPNPEIFEPSRFETAAVSERHPYAFQAFSAGPRNCIGKALARAEALSLMSVLLRRFELSLADAKDCESEPDDYHMITRKPANGIRFYVKHRPD